MDAGQTVPPSVPYARRRILAGEQRRAAAPPVGFPADPGNRYAVVAGVPVVAWPIPEQWAAQATLTQVAADALVETAAAVVAWYAEQAYAQRGGHLEVSEAQAPVLTEALGLVERRRMQVWLATGAVPEAAGELVPPRDLAEFVELFDPALACMLSGQLGRADWELWVLRDEHGHAFADVRLMDLGDTTYLGGLGVEPASRGRGWGRTLAALATRRALERSDVVWLHCERHLGPLYASVGYALIDEHVYLGLP